MRSHQRDHYADTVTHTPGSIFDTEEGTLRRHIYAYLEQGTVKTSFVLSTCHGPIPPISVDVDFHRLKYQFDSKDFKAQSFGLDTVNKYVADFEQAKNFPVSQEVMDRAKEVQKYFQENIKSAPSVTVANK